jgi:hypothetical protein
MSTTKPPSQHALKHLPGTVAVAAVLLVVSAIVLLEHARRLLYAVTMAEETQGLVAIRPLRHEVPAMVIEVLVGGGLLIAAVALIRRSRWAVIFAASVQLVVALDAVRRIVRDLAVAPPIALLVLAALASLAVLAPATRAWCDEPIRPSTARWRLQMPPGPRAVSPKRNGG